MIIDCIGCLHGYLPKLEGGDLLIITGDITSRDTQDEYTIFLEWLYEQSYSKKILISGNHDNFLTEKRSLQKFRRMAGYDKDDVEFEYLCDSGTEFEGFKIWGSPWTAQFKGINPKCCAFTVRNFDHTEEILFEYWNKIPLNTDILITHTPAFGILDGIPREDGSIFHVGSKALYNWLKYVERPKLHVFSHIHEAYGREEHFPTYDDKMMISVNCSIMNEKYKPVNKPMRVIL